MPKPKPISHLHSAPSRSAILKLLVQQESSLPPCNALPATLTRSTVQSLDAMRGLKSGKYVLIHRSLLRTLIKELSK